MEKFNANHSWRLEEWEKLVPGCLSTEESRLWYSGSV